MGFSNAREWESQVDERLQTEIALSKCGAVHTDASAYIYRRAYRCGGGRMIVPEVLSAGGLAKLGKPA